MSPAGNDRSKIKFDYLGIGTVLARNRLSVPPNQREYAWEAEHVDDLFRDVQNAIANSKSTYFLGTIVLTGGDDDILEVADGQQRLATTTILLAAIRDYMCQQSEDKVATSIENDFLFKIIRETRQSAARLTLNIEDNEFFRKSVILRPDDKDRKSAEPKRPSHHKIAMAAKKARERVQLIVSAESERNRIPRLNQWVEFLEKRASVVWLQVPDDLNAFVMFETLNDRGLKTSQADLVKNYLFGEVGDKSAEIAHPYWTRMSGILDALNVDEITVTFLRHFVISQHGVTLKADVLEKIQGSVFGKDSAVSFLETLSEAASDYAAILTPEHKKWNKYHPTMRRYISTMALLGVAQIRPLMLAVARSFSAEETVKAFRLFLSWTVRFLIAGGGRGSALENAYSESAKEVTGGKIATASMLQDSLRSIIPKDTEFKESFATATVSKSHLARYYLRSLELGIKGLPEPELIPNEETVINLEHVLPENPSDEWHIQPEVAEAHYRRIGNMVLLQATVNSTIGNDSFKVKKAEYAKSAYELTKQVGRHPSDDWQKADIDARQQLMSELAVKTWTLDIK